MAVTTTASGIITAALATSAKNRPGYLATASQELLDALTRVERGFFAVAARVNPAYFGAAATVAYDGATGWPRPQAAENVFRVELDGDPVAVVPYDDRDLEPFRAAVYALGGIYRTRGTSVDPTTADELVLYYSRVPAAFTALTDLLDSQWPEAYNQALIADLATYLANKDGRTDDAQVQKALRDGWLALYVNFLRSETTATLRRDFPDDTGATLPELATLLAGGA